MSERHPRFGRSRTAKRNTRPSTAWKVPALLALVALPLAVAGFFGSNSGSPLPNLRVVRSASAGGPIAGIASVIDGDTIEVHGQRIRFNGVDAPETTQQCDDANGLPYQCGARAAAALDEFLSASRPIRCDFVSWDRYGRYVGNCTRADGIGVAGWLVENGQALDWPKYSGGAYADREAAAKVAKRGIWSGPFQPPWDWRADHRQADRGSVPRLNLISPHSLAQSWSCQPRRTCKQIASCEEANWYLNNCSWGGKLDRDSDGIPCESLC